VGAGGEASFAGNWKWLDGSGGGSLPSVGAALVSSSASLEWEVTAFSGADSYNLSIVVEQLQ
jgi:hypothetical protein